MMQRDLSLSLVHFLTLKDRCFLAAPGKLKRKSFPGFSFESLAKMEKSEKVFSFFDSSRVYTESDGTQEYNKGRSNLFDLTY
jgi:hypothetical protein